MRYAIATLSLLGMSLLSSPSHADPYLWCAVYNANGQQSCYFKTLEQCRAATVGGGACSPNLAYDPHDADGYGRRHHAMRY
jgi:hypothetical protein